MSKTRMVFFCQVHIPVIVIVTKLEKNWLKKPIWYNNIEVLVYSILRVIRVSKIFVNKINFVSSRFQKQMGKSFLTVDPLVVYWSWHLPSRWNYAGLNPTLGECFWAKDDQKPTTPSKSCGSSTRHVPLNIWYNWLVSWHIWGVRIRTGKTLGLGKASLLGARQSQ